MIGKTTVILVVSVVAGVAVALMSGLFLTPQSHIGVDVVLRGFPFPWTMQVIPRPEQNVLWDGLLENVVFWIVIAVTISILGRYLIGLGKRSRR